MASVVKLCALGFGCGLLSIQLNCGSLWPEEGTSEPLLVHFISLLAGQDLVSQHYRHY